MAEQNDNDKPPVVTPTNVGAGLVKPLPEVDPWQSQWDNTPPTKPGRDMQGRWMPGTPSPNPAGRKPADEIDKLNTVRKVAEEIIAGHFSEEKWGQLIDDVWDEALQKHSWRAREWLGRYYAPYQQNTAQILRPVPGGVLIEPINDWRAGLAALAPPDDTEDSDESAES